MARPLDQSRTTAILAASIELLVERGYQDFGLRDVADRAEASLSTIYRRWPTKQTLLAAAIDASDPLPIPTATNPGEALRTFLRSRAQFFAANTHHVRGMMAAGGEDEQLANAVAGYISRNVDKPLLALLRSYCDEVGNESLSTSSQLASALLIHRLVVLHERVDADEFATEVIGLVDKLHGT